jgi:cell division protein FtsW
MQTDKLLNTKIKLIAITLVLVLIGLVFVFSAGSMQAIRLGKSESYFFYKQFIAALVGTI